jgi:hypothetical protein
MNEETEETSTQQQVQGEKEEGLPFVTPLSNK